MLVYLWLWSTGMPLEVWIAYPIRYGYAENSSPKQTQKSEYVGCSLVRLGIVRDVPSLVNVRSRVFYNFPQFDSLSFSLYQKPHNPVLSLNFTGHQASSACLICNQAHPHSRFFLLSHLHRSGLRIYFECGEREREEERLKGMWKWEEIVV